MEGGLVLPSTFRVGPAESEVDRAADLLVEQDVADEAFDAKIDTDAELADPPRAIVDGQDLLEKLLAHICSGRDNCASPELKADAIDRSPGVDPWILERDNTLGAVFDRRGVDLAVGDVDVAVADDVGAAGGGEGEIGVVTDDPHSRCGLEHVTNLPIVA